MRFKMYAVLSIVSGVGARAINSGAKLAMRAWLGDMLSKTTARLQLKIHLSGNSFCKT